MQCRIRDFRCKEVINVCDGCRLGYVSDLDVRVPEGQVVAIIVYGPGRFFGLFGRGSRSTTWPKRFASVLLRGASAASTTRLWHTDSANKIYRFIRKY